MNYLLITNDLEWSLIRNLEVRLSTFVMSNHNQRDKLVKSYYFMNKTLA